MTINKITLEEDGLMVGQGQLSLSGGSVDIGQNLTVFGQVNSPTFIGALTGNADTTTVLQTARTIAITGDLTYTSPAFDGSANVTATGILATVNSNVGSFTNASITVNAKGLVTAVSNGTASVTSVTGTSPIVSSGGATPAISIASGYGDTQNPYASKTANTFLAAPNGAAGVPTFRTLVDADIPSYIVNTITSLTYTATATFGTTILLCNTASNNITINLPTAVGNKAVYEIKKTNGANSMIIDGFGTQTIEGDTTITIVVEDESLTLVSDNANWRVI